MAKIISLANQKGGVGKTTTTGAIAVGYKNKGFRVLCIDLDPQSNLTFSLGAQADECATIYDVLKGEVKPLFAIQHTKSVDVIASNILLSSIDLEFTQSGREFLLQKVLKSVKNKYDYIFIDTPPALGILTVNAFTASQAIIIPMHTDIFSLQGIAQLSETVVRVKKYCNPTLKIGGILLTKYDGRTLLSREIMGTAKLVAEQLKTDVFKTTIRMSVGIMEAQTKQESIYSYSPKNIAVTDYDLLINEMIEKGI